MTGHANDVIRRYENSAEGKPSRPKPLDVCSTEDHSHHLKKGGQDD
jgi:hypothetical protein